MNDAFWNTVRGVVGNMLAEQGQARHGIVASVNPANATVRLTLDEDGTPSGWLPIAQQAAGNGWGMVTLPLPGTQVFFAPDMGDMAHGVVLGAVHSSEQPPGKVVPYGPTGGASEPGDPQPITPGETTLIHASGLSLRLTATGVEIHGDLRVNGNLFVSGDISDQNGRRGTLDVLRTDYDAHKHSGVQPGGGTTGTTDHPTP